MTRCTRCGRKLKRQSETGMGPRCQLAVLGQKQKRVKVPAHRGEDTLQADLFADDLAYAHRVDALLGSISLEMP